jgi:hypothetical protein
MRQTVQILVLFEPAVRLGRFGFRLFSPSSSGHAIDWWARTHQSLGVSGGARCRQPFDFSSVAAELKSATAFA